MTLRIGSVLILMMCLIALATTASAQTLRVSAATTNLRAKPAADAPTVATLTQGAELDPIGQEGTWHLVRVRTSGAQGYVHALVVETLPDGTTTAPSAPTAAAPLTPAPPARPIGAAAAGQPVQSVSRDPGFTRREPLVALLLSAMYPGIGQLYNGPTEKKKGLIMIGAATGSLVLAFSAASCDDFNCSPATATLGVLGYLGVGVYSIYDAATRAGQLNREHGLAFNIRPEFFGGKTGVRSSISYTHTF